MSIIIFLMEKIKKKEFFREKKSDTDTLYHEVDPRIRIRIQIKMKRIHNTALYDMFIKRFIYYTICILGNYANSSLLLSFKVSITPRLKY